MLVRAEHSSALDLEPCRHTLLWLARDGYWYCQHCEPPHFQNEVLERRNQQEVLTLWPPQKKPST